MRINKLFSKRLGIATIIAATIIAADYFAGNLSFPIFDSSSDLGPLAFFNGYYDLEDENDKFFAVNTFRDTALAAEVIEHEGTSEKDTMGIVAVSDRGKIARLLEIASKADYKYIVIDLRFEDGHITPYDSLLFGKIAAMPRIVFSKHRETLDTDPNTHALSKSKELKDIEHIAAYADWRSLWKDGFSRYEFIQEGGLSIALRMYEEIEGKGIQRTWWGGYVDSDGSLCRNLQFVPFPKAATQRYLDSGEFQYEDLGRHVLGNSNEESIIRRMNGKVILIGNFDEDRHDSYIGEIPGPFIHYYAWRLLENGGHKINWWLEAFLFIFYTFAIFGIIKPHAEYKPKSILMVLIKALIGWGLVFFLLKSLIYWIFGFSFITIIPSLVFSGVSVAVTVYNSDAFKTRLAKRMLTQRQIEN